ncbi:MAG TPA: hypothetical protein VII16_08480 [Actinomycetes bacterium]|jgi:hypothetical protein
MAVESLKEQQQLIAGWESDLPAQVRSRLGNLTPTVRTGERHGSWFFRLEWVDAGVLRLAELALTNPESTSDDVTTAAVVSVRAGATTNERYVAETLYERRRGLSRLQEGFLADQLAAAVQRSTSYTNANTASEYQTGPGVPLEG